MPEPRFGNKRSESKVKKEKKVEKENIQDVKINAATQHENQEVRSDDFLGFMYQKEEEVEIIPTKQVIFRLPIEKYKRLKKTKGGLSFQDCYERLTDYYLSKYES